MDQVVTSPRIGRRSTRVRVEIPVTVTSLDQAHPFAAQCLALVVSPQGCGLRTTQPLEPGIPIQLTDLPGGHSVTARVANCLPLGEDGQYFLVGASLDMHGYFWGIAAPPPDWGAIRAETPATSAAAAAGNASATSNAPAAAGKKAWPYCLFSNKGESHPGRK